MPKRLYGRSSPRDHQDRVLQALEAVAPDGLLLKEIGDRIGLNNDSIKIALKSLADRKVIDTSQFNFHFLTYLSLFSAGGFDQEFFFANAKNLVDFARFLYSSLANGAWSGRMGKFVVQFVYYEL